MPIPPTQPIVSASPIRSGAVRSPWPNGSPFAISQNAPTNPTYWIGRNA